MVNKKQKILLFFLVVFLFYCSISIGQSWDEADVLGRGKITLDYLFSFGEIDNDRSVNVCGFVVTFIVPVISWVVFILSVFFH